MSAIAPITVMGRPMELTRRIADEWKSCATCSRAFQIFLGSNATRRCNSHEPILVLKVSCPVDTLMNSLLAPMLSPNVWGSLATAGSGDASGEYLTSRWYSASALDYYFRKHFTHGVTFGNINGMSSQFLSAAPPGFVEALERNLLFFKQYRHLLLEDVYHPKIAASGWSSIQYVKEDSTESVVYIFRDKSETADTIVRLRGLDANAKYRVTS